jgi:hypothetical protein
LYICILHPINIPGVFVRLLATLLREHYDIYWEAWISIILPSHKFAPHNTRPYEIINTGMTPMR